MVRSPRAMLRGATFASLFLTASALAANGDAALLDIGGLSLCFPFFLILALLFAALYAQGRSPLAFFDLVTVRPRQYLKTYRFRPYQFVGGGVTVMKKQLRTLTGGLLSRGAKFITGRLGRYIGVRTRDGVYRVRQRTFSVRGKIRKELTGAVEKYNPKTKRWEVVGRVGFGKFKDWGSLAELKRKAVAYERKEVVELRGTALPERWVRMVFLGQRKGKLSAKESAALKAAREAGLSEVTFLGTGGGLHGAIKRGQYGVVGYGERFLRGIGGVWLSARLFKRSVGDVLFNRYEKAIFNKKTNMYEFRGGKGERLMALHNRIYSGTTTKWEKVKWELWGKGKMYALQKRAQETARLVARREINRAILTQQSEEVQKHLASTRIQIEGNIRALYHQVGFMPGSTVAKQLMVGMGQCIANTLMLKDTLKKIHYAYGAHVKKNPVMVFRVTQAALKGTKRKLDELQRNADAIKAKLDKTRPGTVEYKELREKLDNTKRQMEERNKELQQLQREQRHAEAIYKDWALKRMYTADLTKAERKAAGLPETPTILEKMRNSWVMAKEHLKIAAGVAGVQVTGTGKYLYASHRGMVASILTLGAAHPKRLIAKAESDRAAALMKIHEAKERSQAMEKEIKEKKEAYDKLLKETQALSSQLADKRKELEEMRKAGRPTERLRKEYDQLHSQYTEGRKQLVKVRKEYESANKEYRQAQMDIKKGEIELTRANQKLAVYTEGRARAQMAETSKLIEKWKREASKLKNMAEEFETKAKGAETAIERNALLAKAEGARKDAKDAEAKVKMFTERYNSAKELVDNYEKARGGAVSMANVSREVKNYERKRDEARSQLAEAKKELETMKDGLAQLGPAAPPEMRTRYDKAVERVRKLEAQVKDYSEKIEAYKAVGQRAYYNGYGILDKLRMRAAAWAYERERAEERLSPKEGLTMNAGLVIGSMEVIKPTNPAKLLAWEASREKWWSYVVRATDVASINVLMETASNLPQYMKLKSTEAALKQMHKIAQNRLNAMRKEFEQFMGAPEYYKRENEFVKAAIKYAEEGTPEAKNAAVRLYERHMEETRGKIERAAENIEREQAGMREAKEKYERGELGKEEYKALVREHKDAIKGYEREMQMHQRTLKDLEGHIKRLDKIDALREKGASYVEEFKNRLQRASDALTANYDKQVALKEKEKKAMEIELQRAGQHIREIEGELDKVREQARAVSMYLQAEEYDAHKGFMSAAQDDIIRAEGRIAELEEKKASGAIDPARANEEIARLRKTIEAAAVGMEQSSFAMEALPENVRMSAEERRNMVVQEQWKKDIERSVMAGDVLTPTQMERAEKMGMGEFARMYNIHNEYRKYMRGEIGYGDISDDAKRLLMRELGAERFRGYEIYSKINDKLKELLEPERVSPERRKVWMKLAEQVVAERGVAPEAVPGLGLAFVERVFGAPEEMDALKKMAFKDATKLDIDALGVALLMKAKGLELASEQRNIVERTHENVKAKMKEMRAEFGAERAQAYLAARNAHSAYEGALEGVRRRDFEALKSGLESMLGAEMRRLETELGRARIEAEKAGVPRGESAEVKELTAQLEQVKKALAMLPELTYAKGLAELGAEGAPTEGSVKALKATFERMGIAQMAEYIDMVREAPKIEERPEVKREQREEFFRRMADLQTGLVTVMEQMQEPARTRIAELEMSFGKERAQKFFALANLDIKLEKGARAIGLDERRVLEDVIAGGVRDKQGGLELFSSYLLDKANPDILKGVKDEQGRLIKDVLRDPLSQASINAIVRNLRVIRDEMNKEFESAAKRHENNFLLAMQVRSVINGARISHQIPLHIDEEAKRIESYIANKAAELRRTDPADITKRWRIAQELDRAEYALYATAKKLEYWNARKREEQGYAHVRTFDKIRGLESEFPHFKYEYEAMNGVEQARRKAFKDAVAFAYQSVNAEAFRRASWYDSKWWGGPIAQTAWWNKKATPWQKFKFTAANAAIYGAGIALLGAAAVSPLGIALGPASAAYWYAGTGASILGIQLLRKSMGRASDYIQTLEHGAILKLVGKQQGISTFITARGSGWAFTRDADFLYIRNREAFRHTRVIEEGKRKGDIINLSYGTSIWIADYIAPVHQLVQKWTLESTYIGLLGRLRRWHGERILGKEGFKREFKESSYYSLFVKPNYGGIIAHEAVAGIEMHRLQPDLLFAQDPAISRLLTPLPAVGGNYLERWRRRAIAEAFMHGLYGPWDPNPIGYRDPPVTAAQIVMETVRIPSGEGYVRPKVDVPPALFSLERVRTPPEVKEGVDLYIEELELLKKRKAYNDELNELNRKRDVLMERGEDITEISNRINKLEGALKKVAANLSEVRKKAADLSAKLSETERRMLNNEKTRVRLGYPPTYWLGELPREQLDKVMSQEEFVRLELGKAEEKLKEAQAALEKSEQVLAKSEAKLAYLEKGMKDVEARIRSQFQLKPGEALTEVAEKAVQEAAKEIAPPEELEKARKEVENAKGAVEAAKANVEDARLAVEMWRGMLEQPPERKVAEPLKRIDQLREGVQKLEKEYADAQGEINNLRSLIEPKERMIEKCTAKITEAGEVREGELGERKEGFRKFIKELGLDKKTERELLERLGKTALVPELKELMIEVRKQYRNAYGPELDANRKRLDEATKKAADIAERLNTAKKELSEAESSFKEQMDKARTNEEKLRKEEIPRLEEELRRARAEGAETKAIEAALEKARKELADARKLLWGTPFPVEKPIHQMSKEELFAMRENMKAALVSMLADMERLQALMLSDAEALAKPGLSPEQQNRLIYSAMEKHALLGDMRKSACRNISKIETYDAMLLRREDLSAEERAMIRATQKELHARELASFVAAGKYLDALQRNFAVPKELRTSEANAEKEQLGFELRHLEYEERKLRRALDEQRKLFGALETERNAKVKELGDIELARTSLLPVLRARDDIKLITDHVKEGAARKLRREIADIEGQPETTEDDRARLRHLRAELANIGAEVDNYIDLRGKKATGLPLNETQQQQLAVLDGKYGALLDRFANVDAILKSAHGLELPEDDRAMVMERIEELARKHCVAIRDLLVLQLTLDIPLLAEPYTTREAGRLVEKCRLVKDWEGRLEQLAELTARKIEIQRENNADSLAHGRLEKSVEDGREKWTRGKAPYTMREMSAAKVRITDEAGNTYFGTGTGPCEVSMPTPEGVLAVKFGKLGDVIGGRFTKDGESVTFSEKNVPLEISCAGGKAVIVAPEKWVLYDERGRELEEGIAGYSKLLGELRGVLDRLSPLYSKEIERGTAAARKLKGEFEDVVREMPFVLLHGSPPVRNVAGEVIGRSEKRYTIADANNVPMTTETRTFIIRQADIDREAAAIEAQLDTKVPMKTKWLVTKAEVDTLDFQKLELSKEMDELINKLKWSKMLTETEYVRLAALIRVVGDPAATLVSTLEELGISGASATGEFGNIIAKHVADGVQITQTYLITKDIHEGIVTTASDATVLALANLRKELEASVDQYLAKASSQIYEDLLWRGLDPADVPAKVAERREEMRDQLYKEVEAEVRILENSVKSMLMGEGSALARELGVMDDWFSTPEPTMRKFRDRMREVAEAAVEIARLRLSENFTARKNAFEQRFISLSDQLKHNMAEQQKLRMAEGAITPEPPIVIAPVMTEEERRALASRQKEYIEALRITMGKMLQLQDLIMEVTGIAPQDKLAIHIDEYMKLLGEAEDQLSDIGRIDAMLGTSEVDKQRYDLNVLRERGKEIIRSAEETTAGAAPASSSAA